MFEKSTDENEIPKGAIIVQSHWQYTIKYSDLQRLRMCCNGSKKAVPQLHVVSSTLSSCVELPVQNLFFGVCADVGITIYGDDATDAYAHSLAQNVTYLK